MDEALRVRVLLRMLAADERDRAMYRDLLSGLEIRHAARGARHPEDIASRQTLVALDLADGYSQNQIAERWRCNVRTVERDVAMLREQLEPLRRRRLG